MGRELEFYEKAEQSLQTTYRTRLWQPFVGAIKDYELIKPDDRIAVCISGGKDSMLMAKLMQKLEAHSDIPFSCTYLVMDPGYNEANRKKIEDNAALLHIPIQIYESDIFKIANNEEKNPCYLCARMRRGWLYSKAKELGCNKIALGHHFDDVIETTLMGMFFASQLQAMLPKLHSNNFEGMELIRPMYKVHEEDVIAWKNHHGLEFIQCACRFTENYTLHDNEGGISKRQEMKKLIKRLKKDTPELDKSIFNSIHSVCLDTMPGWKKDKVKHSFLEDYDKPEIISRNSVIKKTQKEEKMY